eukprot:125725-Prymnesium_polylepis.1
MASTVDSPVCSAHGRARIIPKSPLESGTGGAGEGRRWWTRALVRWRRWRCTVVQLVVCGRRLQPGEEARLGLVDSALPPRLDAALAAPARVLHRVACEHEDDHHPALAGGDRVPGVAQAARVAQCVALLQRVHLAELLKPGAAAAILARGVERDVDRDERGVTVRRLPRATPRCVVLDHQRV